MTHVTFTIDGHGPFEGTIRPTLREGREIAFISIPIKATELTAPKTITVTTEDGETFDAPVIRITTDGGYREEFDERTTGSVVFGTV